jgi:hypothetical protein
MGILNLNLKKLNDIRPNSHAVFVFATSAESFSGVGDCTGNGTEDGSGRSRTEGRSATAALGLSPKALSSLIWIGLSVDFSVSGVSIALSSASEIPDSSEASADARSRSSRVSRPRLWQYQKMKSKTVELSVN